MRSFRVKPDHARLKHAPSLIGCPWKFPPPPLEHPGADPEAVGPLGPPVRTVHRTGGREDQTDRCPARFPETDNRMAVTPYLGSSR